MTAPTIFNAVLWRATVEAGDGYWIGYYSLMDQDNDIEFRYVPGNRELIQPLIHDEIVKRLLWFSNGYYLLFSDLRFGEIQTDLSLPGQYTFSWKLIERQDDSPKCLELRRAHIRIDDFGEAFDALWTRIKGN
jgi:inner membrane protein